MFLRYRADSYYINYDDLLQYVSSDCVQLTIHGPAAIPLAEEWHNRSRLPLSSTKLASHGPGSTPCLTIDIPHVQSSDRAYK